MTSFAMVILAASRSSRHGWCGTAHGWGDGIGLEEGHVCIHSSYLVLHVRGKSSLPHPTKSHMVGGDASQRAMRVCASTRHAVVIVCTVDTMPTHHSTP